MRGCLPGCTLPLVMAGLGGLCALLLALVAAPGSEAAPASSQAAPASSQAAPAADPAQGRASGSPAAVTGTVTATLFLPLANHQSGAEDGVWYAAYYANANLLGTPLYTAVERRVDYDWGEGSPGHGLPVDHFSARWTGNWDFEVGNYTFFIYADDGVRLWLDGHLIVDSWQTGIGPHQAKRTITADGPHSLILEYFESGGGAAISLGWRRTDLYPQWQAEYYNDRWVETPKVYADTDTAIEFDWGEGCPVFVLDCNNFSISWHASPVLEAGTHRVYIYADDGYQLYVGGTNVKEGGWLDGQSGGGQDVFYDITASNTQERDLRFNFHDGGALAEARLFIQKRGYPDWTAEFYDNRTLSGTPVRTRDDEAVFYDWGWDKPVGALPSGDSFSVRWTGQRFFHAGCYHFGLFADDGVRLWVDGELLVDQWHDGRMTYYSPYTYVDTGYHDVKIEYYEHSGEAEIRFWWE